MKVLAMVTLVIQRIGEVFLVINTSALVIITFYGVVMRYVANAPVMWLIEVSIIMYSWLTFVGAAIAFKRHQHIRIGILESKLQHVSKKTLSIIIQFIVLAFLFFGFTGGLQVVEVTMLQRYRTVDLPIAIFYIPFVVCMVMSFIFVIERTLQLIMTKPEEFKKGEIN